jgi:hypothetical protein
MRVQNYGVILDEIGFHEFLQQLMLDWIAPLARLLFPQYGSSLDSHHGFIVQYKLSEDTELGALLTSRYLSPVADGK